MTGRHKPSVVNARELAESTDDGCCLTQTSVFPQARLRLRENQLELAMERQSMSTRR
jgi:hypothetical protein